MADMFTTAFGKVVDLDDPERYPKEWIDMSVYQLFFEVWSEMGRSLVYMDYFYHDVSWGKQKGRVQNFCRILAHQRKDRMEDNAQNKLWWMKLLYKFKDEIENQC